MPKERWQKWGLLQLSQQLLLQQLLLLLLENDAVLLENDAVQPRMILTHRCTNVRKHTLHEILDHCLHKTFCSTTQWSRNLACDVRRCHSWVPNISPIGTGRLGRHVIRKTSINSCDFFIPWNEFNFRLQHRVKHKSLKHFHSMFAL